MSSSSSQDVPLRRFNPASNPYPAKKSWPPNMSNMDHKHQFRLERRYRRRSQIAYLRPEWTRRVKFAQYTVIMGVVVYAVLGIDWDVGEGVRGPLVSIRKWVGADSWATPFDVKTAHKRIEDAAPGRREVGLEKELGKG